MDERIKGVGVGLRVDMAKELFERQPTDIDWLEVHPENFIRRGGRFNTMLERAKKEWSIATHGLTMCFASTERFDKGYLRDLSEFLKRTETPWHSDHMCFAGHSGSFLHDLVPVPFDEESARTIIDRFQEAQEVLPVPLAIENVSYYIPFSDDGLAEADFYNEVCQRAGASMLLDLNNVFVNSKNFGFDPYEWIRRIDGDKILQMHVAGHLVRADDIRIDTHGEDVPDGVFDLLEFTVKRFGMKPLLLERDNNIPALDEILAEVSKLKSICRRANAHYEQAQCQEIRP